MHGLETIIALNTSANNKRKQNDSGSIQVQGNFSVLLKTDKGYVEARNIFPDKANFHRYSDAVRFSRDLKQSIHTHPRFPAFLESRVVEFHSPEWEQLLAR